MLSRPAATLATALIGLWSALSAAQTATVAPLAMSVMNRTDERYQSYNIEMAKIIGARFWKPYAHSSGTPSASDQMRDTLSHQRYVHAEFRGTDRRFTLYLSPKERSR